jgi:hypothetical protein
VLQISRFWILDFCSPVHHVNSHHSPPLISP